MSSSASTARGSVAAVQDAPRFVVTCSEATRCPATRSVEVPTAKHLSTSAHSTALERPAGTVPVGTGPRVVAPVAVAMVSDHRLVADGRHACVGGETVDRERSHRRAGVRDAPGGSGVDHAEQRTTAARRRVGGACDRQQVVGHEVHGSVDAVDEAHGAVRADDSGRHVRVERAVAKLTFDASAGVVTSDDTELPVAGPCGVDRGEVDEREVAGRPGHREAQAAATERSSRRRCRAVCRPRAWGCRRWRPASPLPWRSCPARRRRGGRCRGRC